jgi:hypothetical protein
MSLSNTMRALFRFGYYIIVGMFFVTVINLCGQSGDLSKPNVEGREALRRLTSPPSTQIR